MKTFRCAALVALMFLNFAGLLIAGEPTSFRLTAELRDGSRVIGTSKDSRWEFKSETLGEMKLPLEKIRSIESASKTNLVKLTTAASDTLLVKFVTDEIHLETAFGSVRLPVELLRSVRVNAMGGPGRPRDGLIALWSGDGNAEDSVGHNHGTPVNVGFTDGVAGRAFQFAPDSFAGGTWCGVQITDRPAFELTKSLTVECWIRPRGNGYMIFCRGDHRPGMDPYGLGFDGHGNLAFYICGEDNDHTAAARTPVESGSWVHVAGVLDDNAGTVSLYTNGVLAAQTATSVRPLGTLLRDQSPGIGIGNVNDGGNNFPFIGEIDEVGLYDRALSVAEINSIYNEHASNTDQRAEPLPPRNGMGMPMIRKRYSNPGFSD
jgi:hypothetical protein